MEIAEYRRVIKAKFDIVKLPFLFISFFYVSFADAQVTIEEIKLKFGSEFHKSKDADVIYPVISTGNKITDDKINGSIIEELSGGVKSINIRKTLMQQMNEGLAELDYDISLNTQDVLSLKLNALGCGAHCSTWNLYLNFDPVTGESIGIGDVINKNDLDSFRSIVFRDKTKALRRDMKKKDSLFAHHEIDSANYEFVTGYVNDNCMKEVHVEKFLLSAEGLEIIDRCEFPYVARDMEPSYELKYSYKKVRALLNPEFVKRVERRDGRRETGNTKIKFAPLRLFASLRESRKAISVQPL